MASKRMNKSTVERVVEIVRQHPGGISSADVAKVMGYSRFSVTACMMSAAAEGLVESLQWGQSVRWFTPEHIAAGWAERDRLRRERARLKSEKKRADDRQRCAMITADAELHAARLAREALLRERKRAAEDAADDPWLAPVRRSAAANAPLPFVCNAPRSVFELGAIL